MVRQVEGGQVRYVVRVGTTGKYLRIGEAEHAILSLLDGTRTLAQVCTGTMAARRERIEPGDVLDFVRRMRTAGVVEPTAAGKNLLLVEKARQRRAERRFAGRIGSLFYFRAKLFDPDRLLDRMVGPLRFFFTRGFVAVAAVLVLVAAWIVAARWPEVRAGWGGLFTTTGGAGVNLLAAWITALLVVTVHEFGHGLTCKHYGGEVHEMGVLLMFFQPCFYCNVNDAWTFESRAAKLWVTAAGGFIETVLGAACVILWALTEPGSAVHGLAYVVFTISLTSTLLFNMNPLIKLDGYYLLADLLRVENLRDRSYRHVGWVVRHVLMGLPAERVARDPGEARLFLVYGVLSMLYMASLLLSILGLLVLAAFGGARVGIFSLLLLGSLAFLMLRGPIGRILRTVSETATSRRATLLAPRTLLLAGAGLAGLVLLACVLPWTPVSAGIGTVEPAASAEVLNPVRGRVVEVLVRDGQEVAAGTPLFRMEAPEEALLAREARARAQAERREALRLRERGDAAAAAARERTADAEEGRAADVEDRLRRLVVSSPAAGTVLAPNLRDLEGALIERRDGEVFRVGVLTRVRVRVSFPAADLAGVEPGREAEVRLEGAPGEPLRGKVVAVSRQNVARAGTGEEAEPVPHWDVVVEAENPGRRALPGMTGKVSIRLARTTVAGALGAWLRRTFRADLWM